MGVDLLILPTAHRHGVTEETIRHALRNASHHTKQDDRMTMYTGPDYDGTPVEVGVVEWHETLAVVHAMKPARRKYL